jgi:hypothetical protein
MANGVIGEATLAPSRPANRADSRSTHPVDCRADAALRWDLLFPHSTRLPPVAAKSGTGRAKQTMAHDRNMPRLFACFGWRAGGGESL